MNNPTMLESVTLGTPSDSLQDATVEDREDYMVFEDESNTPIPYRSVDTWVVMIVDDDVDVHTATGFALSSMRILDRPLKLLHAYSAAEARLMLEREQNVAVILLDVVMETNYAGLELARAIREELCLYEVRIILRTGQPGYAPEMEVISRYDINDYKTKAELTHSRLMTAMTAAVRSYRQILALNESRRGLEMIIHASADLLTRRGINGFSEGILIQIAALLGLPPQGLICAQNNEEDEPRVVAAVGLFCSTVGCKLIDLQDTEIRSLIREAFERNENVFGDNATVLFFGSSHGQRLAAYVATHRRVERHKQYLLRIFCQNIVLANDNLNLIDRLHQQAYIDPLSKLPNRANFIEVINGVIAAGTSGQVVVTMDVDHFGATSETIGSRDANLLLVQIARRLRDRLSAAVEIARVAGDTFGIIGPAEMLDANMLTAIFEEPIEMGGLALTISVTTGRVYLETLANSQGEDILRSAFIALKRAKEQRRGSDQEFTPTLAENLRQRTNLLHDLRQAIQDKEFFLVFQPQVDLVTEKPIGAEALIRWKRRNGDYISPDRFINIAEDSGLIISIGEFVMNEACMELAKLRDAGYTDFRMAINVSVVQWLDRNFPEMVESILKKYKLPHQAVELEITESVAMQGANPVREVMTHFRELGMQIALDDFGTGFSSLSYLQQLPVHRLKIDRAFVGGIEESKLNHSLAETVVRLGRNLGLQVIAEGVENETQANLLRVLGCHEAQGYYYARPMAPSNLMEWLKQHQ